MSFIQVCSNAWAQLKKHILPVATSVLLICLLASAWGCATAKPQVKLSVSVPTLGLTSIAHPASNTSYEFLVNATTAFAEQYGEADVTFEIENFDIAQENEAVRDVLGTDEAPDILYEAFFNMESYIHTGYVVPLDDIITPEIRSDIDEHYWRLGSIDGKVYMMPFVGLQNVIMYNKKLLLEAGLDEYVADEPEIQSWTLDQWQEVLETLRDNTDAYPFFMYANNDQGDTHIMILLRSRGCSFFDADGNVHVNTPEGIAALQWIKDSYDAGLFPSHAENLEINDMFDLFKAGKLGFYIYNSALASSFKDQDIGFVDFPSADGQGYATAFVNGFEVFDNGDPQKVEVAKDFVKFIYENDQWLSYSVGDIPVSEHIVEQYDSQIPMLALFDENDDNVVDFTNRSPNWRGVRAVFWTTIHDLLRGKITAQEAALVIDDNLNAAIQEGRATSKLHD